MDGQTEHTPDDAEGVGQRATPDGNPGARHDPDLADDPRKPRTPRVPSESGEGTWAARANPPEGQSVEPAGRSAPALVASIDAVVDYAIYLLDVDGRVATWNQGAARVLGYTAAEILGQPHAHCFTPEDQAAGLPTALLARAAAAGHLAIEGWRVRRGGERFWASVVITPVRDADGALTGYTKILRDLTALRAARAALEASEERLRLALDAAGEGIWDWDVATGTQHVNAAWRRMLGLAPDTPATVALWEALLHPDDRATAEAAFARHVAGERTHYEADLRLRHEAGHWVWVRTRGQVVRRHVDGTPARVVGTHVDLTAHKATEAALTERTLQLEAAMTAADMGAWRLDVPTRHVWFSPSVARLFGITRARAAPPSEPPRAPSGGSLDVGLEAVHPDDRAAVAAVMQQAVARGGGFAVEYRVPRPDGREVRLLSQGTTVLDATGRPVQLVGIVRDVTSERTREAALRASEARFQLIATHIHEAFYIAVTDARGNLQALEYLSPAAEAIWGRDPASLLDVPALFATFHPDDVPRVLAAKQAAAPGGLETYRYRVVRPDGSARWVRDRRVPVDAAPDAASDAASASAITVPPVPPAGAPPGRRYVGVVEDITERVAAEDALRRQAQAITTMTEAVLFEDATSCVVDCNPAAERLLGRSRAELLGQSCSALWEAQVSEGPPLARVLAELEAHGQWTGEVTIRPPRGRARVALLTRTVLRDADGRTAGGLSVLRDVTEERARTAERHQAQKLASIGRLAGGVAHDFNNLLTVISGNLEFLREDLGQLRAREGRDDITAAVTHDVSHDLAEITQAAERARRLVRQLLLFSRQQPLRLAPLSVDAVVRGAEQLLRRLVGEEIVLVTSLGAGAVEVRADAGQLEQLLMNLAVNARDAMLTPQHGHPGTGGTLELVTDVVTLAPSEARRWTGVQPGRWVRLVVRDTGHGMDAETQAHAFEPFFTTKDVGAGTGLGLATVFGIVRQVGGAVRVDSAPGQGTAFTILLPAEHATAEGGPADERHRPDPNRAPHPVGSLPPAMMADAPPAPPSQPASAGAASAGVGSVGFGAAEQAGRTVLLVEDEAPVRLAARRMLERHGHRVLEARHGADGLALWREHQRRIDLLITDVRMPEMSGPALVAHVRRDAPALPVVYMSGYVDEGAELVEGPHTTFVAKPFTGEALLEAVASVSGIGGHG